jgi:hypothetical protein
VAVPEQRHALGERRGGAEDVVEPPLLQLADGKTAAGRGRRVQARASQQLHDAGGFRTQRRYPIRAGSSFWSGEALHRSAQQADRADADPGHERRGQRLAAGDAPSHVNTRRVDFLRTWRKAHAPIQSALAAHDISRM